MITTVVQEGIALSSGGVYPPDEFTPVRIGDMDFARNVLGKDVLAKTIDFFFHWESDYVVYEIVELSVDIAACSDRPSSRELQKQIMESVGRKEASVIMDLPYVEQNITEDGTCGPQMIENHFHIKRAALMKILKDENLLKGLSNNHIQLVCDTKNVSHIIVDITGTVVFKKSATERNHNHKTLIYVFANEHFYPITDDSVRRALMQEDDTMETCPNCNEERAFDYDLDMCNVCGHEGMVMKSNEENNHVSMVPLISDQIKDALIDAIVLDTVAPSDVVNLMSEYESLPKGEKKHVIVKDGDLQDLFIGMVEEENILADNRSIRLTKVSFMETNDDGVQIERNRLSIAKLRYGNVVFQRNTEYDTVINACKIFHIPFTGQSAMGMILEYFQTICPDASSSYNEESEAWFQNDHLAITKVFKRGLYNHEDIAAIDLSRTYENAGRMKKLPWAIIHSMDYPEPYVYEKSPYDSDKEELEVGKYYLRFASIENQPSWFQQTPFSDGFFFNEIVRYFYHTSVKFTITQQILAQHTLEPNIFDNMFNIVYKAYPDSVAKDNIRKFIGMLNKRTRRQYQTSYSTNEVDLHQKYLGKGFIRSIGSNLYQGFTYKDSTLQENYVPLYQQIIEMSWISMLKMARTVPIPQWVMIKTDELVYLDKNNTLKQISYQGRQIGYKREEITEQKRERQKLFEQRCPSVRASCGEPKLKLQHWNSLDNDKWENFDVEYILSLGSFATLGEGGSGKSFIVKKLIEYLGDSVLVTSSTHVTAIGIDGDTLHSGLRYDSKKKCFMQSLETLSITHIIINEALMLDRDVLRALYWLKKHNPEINFILLGDPTQLPPVKHRINGMNYDISTSSLFMRICDFQRFSLTKNYRNAELTELYKHVGDKDFDKRVGKNSDTKLHVIFDNYRRRKLGLKVAKEECKRLKRKPMIIQGKNDEFIVFRSMKVYANETHKKLNILNKESFTVTSNQNKDGTFDLKSDLRQHVIKVTPDIIMSKFEYYYAKTVYGVQGVTIDEPYTIHRWNKLIYIDKVVAVGRARKTEYINICPGCDVCNAKISLVSITENELNESWESANLAKKKELSLDFINRILRGKASDEFCELYTGLSVSNLKKFHHIEEGIPKGFAIDHIKARASFTEDDIHLSNHYTNLQIISERLNSLKGAKEISYYLV